MLTLDLDGDLQVEGLPETAEAAEAAEPAATDSGGGAGVGGRLRKEEENEFADEFSAAMADPKTGYEHDSSYHDEGTTDI